MVTVFFAYHFYNLMCYLWFPDDLESQNSFVVFVLYNLAYDSVNKISIQVESLGCATASWADASPGITEQLDSYHLEM